MEHKIKVKVCTGTLCYVMGGAELQLLEEHLTPDIAPYVEISGTPCLDVCDNPAGTKAPYVEVDGKLIEDASISKVMVAIKEILDEKQITTI